MTEKKWLTTEEAADRLGKSARMVRIYCRNGDLTYKKEGKQFLVDADSVEAFLQKTAGLSDEDVQETAHKEESEQEQVAIDAEAQSQDVRMADEVEERSSAEMDEQLDDAIDQKGKVMEPGLPKHQKEFLDHLRGTITRHLQNEQEFCANLQNQINELEKSLNFQYNNNWMVQDRLVSLIRQLETQPRVGTVDSKKKGFFKRLFRR